MASESIFGRRRGRALPALVLAALASLVGPNAQALPQDRQNAAAALSRRELETSREVAEAAIERAKLRTSGRLLLVEQSLELGKDGKRLAHVVHYRYDGDLAITTIVDLSTRAAIAQYTVANQPTALASEEVQSVRRLVLANERVLAALGTAVARVQLVSTVLGLDKDQPLFGRRVVQVEFKVDETIMAMPFSVLVDLTGQRVVIEAPKAATQPS